MAVQPIFARDVAKKVINKEKLFILDVRNEDAFKDWKIEGENFEYLNVPYFDLLDGVESILEKLPKAQEIVVVCAKEGSAMMIADMLDEVGIEASYFKGGMKDWSEYLEPVKIGNLNGGGELYQFVRLGKGCLSYMILSNGEAAIIDPTRMTQVFTDFAKEKQAPIKHVFDTHLHADHISGGRQIAKETGATYWLPPKDAREVVYQFEPLASDVAVAIGNSTIDIHAL